jgi:outer membrane protein TolC
MKILKFGFALLVCRMLLLVSQAQPKTALPDSLSIDAAVAIALQNHPSLHAAEAGLRSASAGVTQAFSAYYPALNASATMQRTDGAFVLNPTFPPRNQSYNTYTAALSATETI